jgi:uncharacterized Zn finger protein
MPSLRCPSCDKLAPRQLEESSRSDAVNYYRCSNCGHVWTIDKFNPAKVTHVTPLTKKPPSAPA